MNHVRRLIVVVMLSCLCVPCSWGLDFERRLDGMYATFKGNVLVCTETFWSGAEAGPIYVVEKGAFKGSSKRKPDTSSRALHFFAASPGDDTHQYLESEYGIGSRGLFFDTVFYNKRLKLKQWRFPAQGTEEMALADSLFYQGHYTLTTRRSKEREQSTIHLICNKMRNFQIKESALPQQPDEPICKDRCGDGICEEIVCHGTGCICAESEKSCPLDCH